MATNSPNMNLILSTVNVDSGLSWENNLNSSLTILDGHNHTSGNGVQIPPNGLNINGSLTFQNNQAINLRATVFSQQSSLATLNALWVGTDGNLYFNDGAADPSIKITAGGVVNATSSGISSGTASASFVGSVLVINQASNTPANIQAGSILIGNNVSASKFLTLSAPGSLGSNATLTLPVPPGSTNAITMSSSGTMGFANFDAAQLIAGSVTSTQIATHGVAQANLALRSTGTTVGAGGVAISASCGAFGTTGNAISVTNLSVTITTTGRPIFVGLQQDGSGTASSIACAGDGFGNVCSATFSIFNGLSIIANHLLEVGGVSGTSQLALPSSVLSVLDIQSAGTYTYVVKISSSGGGHATTAFVQFAKLVAYEI